jgi:superfamily II DNA helicase RecQ
MDECHVVLDSGPNFRPKLRALGAEMVQAVDFLSATADANNTLPVEQHAKL